MEWVETTGKSVEGAKELALDQLGIDHDEAEFVIVEEPRQGLFGRTRGEARVRARIAPRTPRAKVERRPRKGKSDARTTDAAPKSRAKKVAGDNDSSDDAPAKKAPAKKSPAKKAAATRAPVKKTTARQSARRDDVDGSDSGSPTEGTTMTLTLEEQITSAESFLNGLLNAFDLDGTVETQRIDDSTAELNIVGDDLGLLIGPRGQTIASIQELTRISLQRQANGSYEGRVRIDVGGFREKRREALGRFVAKIAEEVLATGTPKALEPMSASDRKAVHDAINEIDGVHTSSEGAEPRRWVMILPDES